MSYNCRADFAKAEDLKIFKILGLEAWEVFKIKGHGEHRFWLDNWGILRCDGAFRTRFPDLSVTLCRLINEEDQMEKTGQSALYWD